MAVWWQNIEMSASPPTTSASVSARMRQQRSRNTVPELALRRVLHARGRRFRVEYPIPGLPRRRIDIAFTRARVAVFVDGCFWHSCPEHGTSPGNNAAWWKAKLEANRRRDDHTVAHLENLGWSVIRIWEHESAISAADVVEAMVRSRAPQV